MEEVAAGVGVTEEVLLTLEVEPGLEPEPELGPEPESEPDPELELVPEETPLVVGTGMTTVGVTVADCSRES
jgi:hypothetical protein